VTTQPLTARRRPWSLPAVRQVDVVVAAAVAVVQIVGTTVIAHRGAHTHGGCWWGTCHPARHLGAGAVVLLLAGPLALPFRRRYPVAVLAVVFAATGAYSVIGYPAGPIYLSLIIAFATVVIAGYRLLAWLAIAAGWALSLWLPVLFGTGHAPSLAAALSLAAWLLALLAGSETIRGRRERAAAVAQRRRQEGLRRAEEERLRIARELHDVLAHNISLINVQSGVALHLLDEQPQQARSALTVINEASAEALREMRSVLGVLRRVDEQAPRAPTAGLARLDDLLARSAAAGVQVDFIPEGKRRTLPTSVELAAFRIIQESLTNVARHSTARAATVRLRYGPRDLLVQIDDEGRGVAADADAQASGGSGIVGMRERATALGGDLVAGPRAGGGFRVLARLPIASVDEPSR
jgi:signal transduction histidine kinase